MAVASFETLCCGLCELVGTTTPSLERDEDDALGVLLELDGVEVTLAHEPARSARRVYLLVAFGSLPPGQELTGAQALMDINAALLRHGGACFSRHPVTGDVTLQSSFLLDDATPVACFARIHEMVALARRWRQHEFVSAMTLPLRGDASLTGAF